MTKYCNFQEKYFFKCYREETSQVYFPEYRIVSIFLQKTEQQTSHPNIFKLQSRKKFCSPLLKTFSKEIVQVASS